jgi:pimeloyl-ACP methyl ester carboxylesterase
MPDAKPISVEEMALGPELPTLRIGGATRTLVYLPGLSIHPGLPGGRERKMATSGWEPLLDRYSVHRIGRRVRPIGTSFDDMATDVGLAIEELGAPVDLMGASTGGIIAMHVAAGRPDLVRRLVVVISGTTMSPWAHRFALRVIAYIRAGRWRRAYATIMSIGGTSPFSRAAYTLFGWLLGPRLIGTPEDPTLVLAELEAWLNEDATGLVERIECPTLVIGTESDPVFPPSATRAFAAGLGNGTVVIADKLAHNFPLKTLETDISPFLEKRSIG